MRILKFKLLILVTLLVTYTNGKTDGEEVFAETTDSTVADDSAKDISGHNSGSNLDLSICKTRFHDTEKSYKLEGRLADPRVRKWKHMNILLDNSYFSSGQAKIFFDCVEDLKLTLKKCDVTFEIWPANYKPSKSADYVYIHPDSVCFSLVGMKGGMQEIKLTPGCVTHDIILHELLHTLGFWHEHERPDRDDYVTIHWDNIKTEGVNNYIKVGSSFAGTYNYPYNFNSVMHYRGCEYAQDPKKKTITRKSGGGDPSQSNRANFTGNAKIDIKKPICKFLAYSDMKMVQEFYCG